MSAYTHNFLFFKRVTFQHTRPFFFCGFFSYTPIVFVLRLCSKVTRLDRERNLLDLEP